MHDVPSGFEISGREIGQGLPAYIVAEMSANHHQDFDHAVRLIETAKENGAEAIKLQTYTPDTLTIDVDSDLFRCGKGSPWEGRTRYSLYEEAHMPWEWQPALAQIANDLGLDLFSTAYDDTAVDFLEEMDVPAYKVASFELVDLPLLRRVAQTHKPVILSTGMATLCEIDEAIRTIREAGARQLALLKCTSAYPAPAEEVNLRTIPHLAEAFDVPVGLSDHTLAIGVPVAAVALGACIVEKHLTLSRADGGPDSAFSVEPHEFKEMVEAIRVAENALGRVRYDVTDQERESRVARRSLFVVEDVKAGERFTRRNVRSIRAGHGLHTRYLGEILGRRAADDARRGTPLTGALVAEGGF